MKTVPCPQCSNPVDLSEKTAYRPFCSERCRLIDLGAWAAEEYQISTKSPLEEVGDPEFPSDEMADWDTPDRLH